MDSDGAAEKNVIFLSGWETNRFLEFLEQNRRNQTMRTKITTITKIALLFALGCAAACTTGTASNSNTASQTADKTATNAAQPEIKTEANTVSTETVKTETIKTEMNESPAGSLATPTAAYKTAYAARQKKDLAALKRVMSKDALEFLSIIVGPGKTVDDALQQMTETPQAATDESRNEKINGDTARLEYPDAQGNWKTMDFVKEGSEWKLTMPKANSPGAEK